MTSLTPELLPSPLPSQTYLEIFIYCLGFFFIIILTVSAVMCRLCCAQKKRDFNRQLAVQKLAKSIPLGRHVRPPLHRPPDSIQMLSYKPCHMFAGFSWVLVLPAVRDVFDASVPSLQYCHHNPSWCVRIRTSLWSWMGTATGTVCLYPLSLKVFVPLTIFILQRAFEVNHMTCRGLSKLVEERDLGL